MPTNGRAYTQYKKNAERLGIPYLEYISNGETGGRYCSVCLKWKSRHSFKEYPYTLTYYSGICKSCSSGKSAPSKKSLEIFNISPAAWGPSLRAAAKIGIEIRLYLQKRAENLRWCSDHKDWFDATELLKGNNPSITRCKDCNRTRQQEFRAMRKKRKQGNKELSRE